ncbi:hypothetical protein Mapa_006473 [Marchantia paleacea]|nr:hypothetical protein Mapa_006473 [Marchantia paleacea]
MPVTSDKNPHIREVWAWNLEDEFKLIRNLVDDYPYVAMDTEFPGIVVKPMASHKDSEDYAYQIIKTNVNMLNLIQLGLTFSDENGNLPRCGDRPCAWQFNFKDFNLETDVYALDSIELLKRSGIQFEKNTKHGADARAFAELLMSSGAVLNDQMTWVTFHSSYDFAYLLKLLTGRSLPDKEFEFLYLLKTFFPNLYDIKFVMKYCDNLYGGLNQVAETLEVERVGPSHQAGSDSLLTSDTFHKLRHLFLQDCRFLPQYAGVLYGLGVDNAESNLPL